MGWGELAKCWKLFWLSKKYFINTRLLRFWLTSFHLLLLQLPSDRVVNAITCAEKGQGNKSWAYTFKWGQKTKKASYVFAKFQNWCAWAHEVSVPFIMVQVAGLVHQFSFITDRRTDGRKILEGEIADILTKMMIHRHTNSTYISIDV